MERQLTSIKEIEQFLKENGLASTHIRIQDINMKDGFFQTNKNLYDQLSERGFEDVEYDRKAMFLADHGIDSDCRISDAAGLLSDLLEDEAIDLSGVMVKELTYLHEEIRSFFRERLATGEDGEEDLDEWVNTEMERALALNVEDLRTDEYADLFPMVIEESLVYGLEEMTLGEVEKAYPNFHRAIMDALNDWVSEADWDDLIEHSYLFGHSEDGMYEASDIAEALAYWTVYFEPEKMDEEVAYKCDLIPFSVDGTNYLALGGCGMDLSPRLDAYQALTVGSVPSRSMFAGDEKDLDYAKYVVGEDVFAEVMKAIKRDPVIRIYTRPSAD